MSAKPKYFVSGEKVRKTLTVAEAYAKIRHFCAYQERSHREVKNKLYEYGLHASEVDDLLAQSITDGFLNEERYAKAFAGGKFRIKQWGRIKIQRELEAEGLTHKCVTLGLKEIDSDEYITTLKKVIQRKLNSLNESNLFVKKDKVARYAIGKGYEPELVWSCLKDLLA